MSKYLFTKTWFVCLAVYFILLIVSVTVIASPLIYVFYFPLITAQQFFHFEVQNNILSKTLLFLHLAVNSFLVTTLLSFVYVKLVKLKRG
jgi:hypothetical protein